MFGRRSFLTSLSLLIFPPSLCHAFTWQFTNPPQQCGPLKLTLSGGSPPYDLLLVPTGPTTFPNGTEVRRLLEIVYSDSNTPGVPLPYPANSTFVAVVSDSTGFGSGATTSIITVLDSNNTSCFNASKPATPDFVFSIEPVGGLTQCQSTRFYWQQSLVQGNVTFQAIIPGNTSFEIPISSITTDSSGTGFNWTVDVKGGTDLIVVASDERGPSGGEAPFTVNQGSDSSCLNSSLPSSSNGSSSGSTTSSSSASSAVPTNPGNGSAANTSGAGDTLVRRAGGVMSTWMVSGGISLFLSWMGGVYAY